MGADYQPGKGMFDYQAPSVLNQPNPAQDVYYPLFDEENCRVYAVAVNIEDTNETLEVRTTINGQVIDPTGFACAHSVAHYAYLAPEPIGRTDRTYLDVGRQYVGYNAFFGEGRHVVIEVRKTTAAGIGNLTGIVMWGLLT